MSLYAAATPLALAVLVLGRRAHPTTPEVVMGLLNVPVAGTFLSVVVLALVTGALILRKRAALWIVAAFQMLGVYLGMVALLPGRPWPLMEVWESRGDLGRGLDIASMLIAVGALGLLYRLRAEFCARFRPGSWSSAAVVLITGTAATVLLTWVLLHLTRSDGVSWREVLLTGLRALSGWSGRQPATAGLDDMVAAALGLTVLAAMAALLHSARPATSWTPEQEIAVRRLVAEHGARDSLAYFATRRDKATIFAPDGSAAITYRVVAGVSLASADPIGRREAWGRAIEAWRSEARRYGWVPAVMSCSEEGATAYAAHGLGVIGMGDEAILDPGRFDLSRVSMASVRAAVRRTQRAGLTVRLRRQDSITPAELNEIVRCAQEWRGADQDRGFSMALNRAGDPADGAILHVTAHDGSGALVGLLSMVPWGTAGVSLDVMRRSPQAPNGVTELMVSELMNHAREQGLRRVSLNFCMFRNIYADADRIGARPLTRAGSGVLGVLDRFWQLERLYRSNQKYEPQWVPRFMCYEDALSLPHVALAASVAEGFLPWPSSAHPGSLDAEQLNQVRAIDAAARDVSQVQPRRSGQTWHRLGHLSQLRSMGLDPYVAGGVAPEYHVADLLRSWMTGRKVVVSGRVIRPRRHGGVVFAGLRDDDAEVQLLLERSRIGVESLQTFARLIDDGDLIRVSGRLGFSRNGTPSILAESWTVEAKCLHPVPWRSFTNPQARMRDRSMDLLVNAEALNLVRARSAVATTVRALLQQEGYLEVETPVLTAIHGGASARPFRTRSNAYGVDLTLRIAPELHLKRLIVAGIGPVFELGRNFRNEGADSTHNPEFTSLEVYRPYADYTVMRHLAERLVKQAATAVHGREALPLPPAGPGAPAPVNLVDISGPWPVVPVLDAVSKAVGTPVDLTMDPDELVTLANQHDVALRADMGPGAIIEALYARLVEPATMTPTFYTDFPVETSPLTMPHRTIAGLVERWDLVIAGMEIGTAYSELTDPVDQRNRLTEQSARAAAGDPEAMELDEDFLHALEIGMPPTGGLGIGVDRLAMVVTNTPIRSVLAFPFVRPARDQATEQ
ncbi:bifunctional lysylphosphatidylglycerol synthetase/lysine--tRNA ligase LysX [Micromonospora sp. NPDC005220]|uniref:bifunctional lysylphosphatidylglycerol synthetase/lysine--tRNA ligase LysX n=1 Tax=Micromonospora sp. NPDC005220 TaxID=3155589 RepID=UPI0033B013E4